MLLPDSFKDKFSSCIIFMYNNYSETLLTQSPDSSIFLTIKK
jgi:hypothetical protein